MLRESREKERHKHLANISKQIVSPEPVGSNISDSIPQSRQGGYASNVKSQVGIGLPPSGSPIKKKASKANLNNREDEVLNRIRQPLNIPK